MWLEAKIVISIFVVACIAIVMTSFMLIPEYFLLTFLCIVAIGLTIFGDLLIGYQIKHNHVDVLMDPIPSNQEVCALFDFSGNLDFVRCKKGPLGVREFVKYKKEASIINTGDYQIKCINGNHGFIGHESYDKNVNMYKAEALDKLKGDTMDEIMDNLPVVPVVLEEENKK